MRNRLYLLPILMVGSKANAAPKTNAAPIKICFEAESAVSFTKPLKLVRQANDEVSNNWFLQMPETDDHLKGVATYEFKVVNAGTYYVFLRTMWTDRFRNQLSISINNKRLNPIGQDGGYNFWHWVGPVRGYRCETGINTLVLRDMDRSIKIDQIFLVSDKEYIPTGKRRATQ